MWDRSTNDEAIEIPMVVLMPETAPAVERWDEAPEGPDPDAPSPVDTDPVLLPREGTGTWPNGERAVRLGNAEEILITLATDPFAAMDAARTPEVLAQPIRRLRIDIDSRRDGDFEVSWTASLRTAPFRWRTGNLRVYASPSLNVTVMTIVPDRANKVAKGTFVRHGLRAAREFGRHIDARVSASVTRPVH